MLTMFRMIPFWTLFFLQLTSDQWAVAESRRVVVIPMPHTSHTRYHTNVARQLVKLGHQVWMTIPDYLVAKGTVNTSQVLLIEYSTNIDMEEESMRLLRDKYFSGESDDVVAFFQIMQRFCDTFLQNDTLFQEIRKREPEFIVIDNVLLGELSVIPYRLQVPFAFVGSAYDSVSASVPTMLHWNPIPLLPYSDRMTLAERLHTLAWHSVAIVFKHIRGSHIASTYAPEMPYLSLSKLIIRADLWLVETDHILDYPRPSLPNVKLIGGTAAGPAKPLPPNFRSFMDSAAQGVVIVSFGSYVLDLPQNTSDKVMHMLLELPLKSVFRSRLASPDPTKILTASWIPQNDLLGHPNTKVFFTHCGKNGQYEALYHAVPMLSAPIFSDQFYNAKRVQVKGFSETVDIRTSTVEEMRTAVMKVATEKRYKEAISRASELFRIEFGVPMERAAFWLDHVMKYGAAHMRSAGQDVPFYQFIGLDILILLSLSLFTVISVLGLCCCLCLKRPFCRKQKCKEE